MDGCEGRIRTGESPGYEPGSLGLWPTPAETKTARRVASRLVMRRKRMFGFWGVFFVPSSGFVEKLGFDLPKRRKALFL